MNKVILVGRLTRDPEVRYSSGDQAMAIARYSLAVDRRGRRDSAAGDQQTADFINIVAFGRDGEFAEKYLRKGMRILVEGHIQTGSYTNKDGQKVYTTMWLLSVMSSWKIKDPRRADQQMRLYRLHPHRQTAVTDS